MNKAQSGGVGRLTVRAGEMVFDVPSVDEGVDEIVLATGTYYSEEPGTAIDLGGAWKHLVDGDAMLEALDRLGREAPPTPPIMSIG
jgi:hypothetical protein